MSQIAYLPKKEAGRGVGMLDFLTPFMGSLVCICPLEGT